MEHYYGTSYMDSYLAHHGIIGQKWGVRRFQNKDGTRTAAGKKHEAQQEKAQEPKKEKKKSTLSDLSDDELRAMVNRMQLERQFSQLAAPQKQEKSRARKLVEDMAEQTVRSLATKGIERLTNELLGEKKESVTNYNFTDFSKVSDDKLAKALKRATQEAALKKLQNSGG